MTPILHTFQVRNSSGAFLRLFLQSTDNVMDAKRLRPLIDGDKLVENLPCLGEHLSNLIAKLPAQRPIDTAAVRDCIARGSIADFLRVAQELACGLTGREVAQAAETPFGAWCWSVFEIPYALQPLPFEPEPAAPVYTVVVGDIGDVFEDTSFDRAKLQFEHWKEASQCVTGRAAGEPVTMRKDGEPMPDFDYHPNPTVAQFDAALLALTGLGYADAGLDEDGAADWIRGFESAAEAAEAWREKYGMDDITG
jgi:hypothetical protein